MIFFLPQVPIFRSLLCLKTSHLFGGESILKVQSKQKKITFAKILLEKAMAPHSSTLAWKIPWTEEPGRLQSTGWWRVGHTERLLFHFSLSCIGEGNGNPLQCSCLENPRDEGAWWAAIYGVTHSRTQMKWLSSSSSKILLSLGYCTKGIHIKYFV